MWRKLNPRRQFILSVLVAMAVCAGLLLFGAAKHDSGRFSYLMWNLFLAALPLVFAVRLCIVLRRKRLSDWEPIGWLLLWVLFVPNSFYLISDYIHLREIARPDILFNAVMFSAFIFMGVLLGYCSLYLIHLELRRRLQPISAAAWIALTLLICCFAIYIGRDLRWNSWDVVFNPGGLLFDISDRILRPEAYPEMFITVLSFFALLSSVYAVFWSGAKLLRR